MRIWSFIFLSMLATTPVLAQPTVVPTPVEQTFAPGAKVTWNASHTAPKRVTGLSVATTGTDAGERAKNFVRTHATLLGLDGDVQVEEVRVFTPPDPRIAHKIQTTVRLRPQWRGLPIEGRSIVVRIDAEQRVTSVASDLGPLSIDAPERVITAAEAGETLKATYRIVGINTPDKVVLTVGNIGRVTWKFMVAVLPLQAQFQVWVDVATGEVLREAPGAFDQSMSELPKKDIEQ